MELMDHFESHLQTADGVCGEMPCRGRRASHLRPSQNPLPSWSVSPSMWLSRLAAQQPKSRGMKYDYYV